MDFKKIHNEIKSSIDNKSDRSLVERRWLQNLNFLEGKQHIEYDRTLGDWKVQRSRSDVQVTINLLLPLYRNVQARLATAYPGAAVIPASPSHEDVIKSQSSEAALRYYWQQERLDDVFSELISWLLTCGNAGLLTYVDKDNKDRAKICTKAISPFDIFYEENLARLDDALWVAIRNFVPRDELKEMYPDHAEYIELYGNNSSTNTQGVVIDPDSCPPGMVDMYEVYSKDGTYCFLLGDKVLFEGECPAKCFPFQHVRYNPIPNRLWGTGLIGPLVELQSLYNAFRTQLMVNVKNMTNPKWLVPKSSGVAPNAITNRPGEKVFYNPAGGTPQQIPGVPLPGYVIDNMNRIQAEIGDVAGLHSTALGKRAVGISSGKAIEALTEQGLSSLRVTQREIESAAEKMATSVLLFMKDYYDEARMVRMMDGTGAIAWSALSSSDIVEDPEIFIEAGSLFQANVADKEARTIQLFQAGLLDKETAAKEVAHRTGGSHVLKRVADVAHAKEILDSVVQGAATEIFPSDNIQIFSEVFGDFIRSREFYAIDPERQEYIRDIFTSLVTYNPETSRIGEPVFPNVENPMEIAEVGSGVTQAQMSANLLDLAGREADIRELEQAQAIDTVPLEANPLEGE